MTTAKYWITTLSAADFVQVGEVATRFNLRSVEGGGGNNLLAHGSDLVFSVNRVMGFWQVRAELVYQPNVWAEGQHRKRGPGTERWKATRKLLENALNNA